MSQVTIAPKNSVITQEEHLSIRGTKPRLAGTKKGWITPYYSCYFVIWIYQCSYVFVNSKCRLRVVRFLQKPKDK